MSDELIPIDDDELLYRRVSVRSGWYDKQELSPHAFGPNRNDQTGISVFRARYRSIDSAARGPSPDGYYVVVLQAGELRGNGIRVEPQPEIDGGWDISHAELPDLNVHAKKVPERHRVEVRPR